MMNVEQIIAHGDNLFSKRGTLLSLWQEIADNFYPERADFTVTRTLGTDFAEHLTTSYPLLVRRDLGNSFGSMLRPSNLQWFHMRSGFEEEVDQAGKEWLEAKSIVMRRAMYDRRSLFTRATKEGDHDFAAFGQTVLSAEMNRNADGLLFRCWHLRDVAWCEDSEGKVSTIHRKWKPTARDLVALFRGNTHEAIREKLTGSNPQPYCEINCRHVVMPTEDYGDERLMRFPYVSVFIDLENKHIMEIKPQTHMMYVVPRWQTVSGSQYAFSPATVAALPDGRLIQAMTRTLLEAGEKAANPPMVAVQEALRSDISIYAGGVTWVDAAYDERLGEVLRPITQDKSGMPVGFGMRDDLKEGLREAFFLNTLMMPQSGPEMTAYEVAQRVQEYIRAAAPIFEPMEADYNGGLCEVTFELLLRAGAFGPVSEIPDSLRGREIGFRFESPLHDAIERQKVERFTEVKAIVADTVALDASIAAEVDVKTAFREAIQATGAPAKWLRSPEEADEIIAAEKEAQATQQLLETMGQGAEVAKTMGEAGQALGPDALAA